MACNDRLVYVMMMFQARFIIDGWQYDLGAGIRSKLTCIQQLHRKPVTITGIEPASATTPVNPTAVLWYWGDEKVYRPYSQQTSDQIERGYQLFLVCD